MPEGKENDWTNLGLAYGFKGNEAFLYRSRFFHKGKCVWGWKAKGNGKENYRELGTLDR